jgi:hypothetical protein
MIEHAWTPIQWGDDALYEAALVVERDTRLTCEMTEWEAATIGDGLIPSVRAGRRRTHNVLGGCCGRNVALWEGSSAATPIIPPVPRSHPAAPVRRAPTAPASSIRVDVGDAADARDEQHRTRAQRRDQHRIVAGGRNHVARRKLARLGFLAQQPAKCRIKRHRPKRRVGINVDRDSPAPRDTVQRLVQFLLHLDSALGLLVPHITMQTSDVGDIAARVGKILDPRGGGAARRFRRMRDTLDGQDDFRRRGQAVAPPIHRGWADMAGFAGHGQLEIARMHRAGDDADVGAGRLHHRTLLDMRLQPARPATRRRCQRASLSARLKRIAHADTVVVGDGQRIFQHHVPGMRAAPHHRGTEAAAFLVGPVHQFEQSARPNSRFVQCTHHFQTGQHTEHAVEPSAGRHRVEVAPKGDGVRCRVRPLPPEEHVADCILLEAQAERPAPFQQQCARLCVLGRKCEAATAAFRRRPNACHIHDRLPQPVCIDRWCHASPGNQSISPRLPDTSARAIRDGSDRWRTA